MFCRMREIDRLCADTMQRLFLILLCAGFVASPALADDAGEANRLMLEAIQLIQASEVEPSAEGKFILLKQAHDNLIEIVEQYPSTDLAVKLATGQRIGNMSLAGVREAMEQARVPEPRTPGAPVRVWRLTSDVVGVASIAAGRRVLTAGENGDIAVHDVRTGELVRTWQHRGELSAFALSPRGQRALTMGKDGSAALRDVRSGRVLGEWQHKRAVKAVVLTRDEGLALIAVGRKAFLVDVGDLKVVRSWRGGSPVTAVALDANGRWMLAGFADGQVLLGEVETGKILHTWKHRGSGGGGVMSAVFSSDGRRVLTGAANRTAVLRDVATGRSLHEWKVGNRVTSVGYSSDGRWVLTGDEGHEIELHDARTGKTVRKWRYSASATATAFSPNSRQALMGFADGVVILCDIRPPGNRREYARTRLRPGGGCW